MGSFFYSSLNDISLRQLLAHATNTFVQNHKKMDKVTQQRIESLHPLVRNEVAQIISEIDKELTGRAMVRITQALRTFEEQNNLYAQGRTKKGLKVTNAKGGQSIHNYGLAVDIALIIDGKTASWNMNTDWDDDGLADWMECVSIFKKYGWNWGGDWKSFKDGSHFEKEFLRTPAGKLKINNWRELIQMKQDKLGYIIL